MKETPILFKPEMIRAILDDRKTQTRRLIKMHHRCPYGRKGDLLWVKEGFGLIWLLNGYALSGPPLPDKSDIKNFVPIYKNCMSDFEESLSPYFWSPLFMFKEHARIWLELTADPIPQRLQDITEEDAIAEGVGHGFQMNAGWPDYEHIKNGICELTQDTARMSFVSLIDKINGPRSWEKNPWVWKLKFKRIEK